MAKDESEYSESIKVLLDKLYSIGTYIQGSQAALRERRREIQAMIVRYGPPHFYITLNPADLHHPLFLHLAGERIDLSKLLFSSDAYRTHVLAANPVAQAQFFDKIINCVFQILFGFRNVGKKGVLGNGQGFYGVYEAQGRGSLHIHSLVWLKERLHIPTLRKKMNDISTQERIIALLEQSVFQSYSTETELKFDHAESCSSYLKAQLNIKEDHEADAMLQLPSVE